MKKLGFIVLSMILLGLDLGSKGWIEANLSLGASIEIIPGFFDLTYLRNTGAAWSLFNMEFMRPVFLGLSLIVSVILVYYFIKETMNLKLLAIAFIFAGNLGNFLDRLRFGYVRDMLSFNIFGYKYPVFNIADTCLVLGFVGVIILMMLQERGMLND